MFTLWLVFVILSPGSNSARRGVRKTKCIELTILKGEYPHFHTKGGGGGLLILFLEIAL